MVKAKRNFVLASFVPSGLAVVASFVALGTQYWTSADVTLSNRVSTVNYGLFGGMYTRIVSTPISYELSMTCLISENVCAMLCESTSDQRTQTLEKLFNNENPPFGCVNPRSVVHEWIHTSRNDTSTEREFINAGVWITTIVFLILSCVAGLTATVLAMWNTVYNPIEMYLNIIGLYIWNGLAAGFSLLTVITWGIHFAITLTKDICVYDTIKGDGESEGAILHFSYWLNLVAFLLYIVSIIILAVRQHLLNNDPVENHNIDESADPGLLIY